MEDLKQQQDVFIKPIIEGQKSNRTKKPIFQEEIRRINSKVNKYDIKLDINLNLLRNTTADVEAKGTTGTARNVGDGAVTSKTSRKLNLNSKSTVDFSFKLSSSSGSNLKSPKNENISPYLNTYSNTASKYLSPTKVVKEYTYKNTENTFINTENTFDNNAIALGSRTSLFGNRKKSTKKSVQKSIKNINSENNINNNINNNNNKTNSTFDINSRIRKEKFGVQSLSSIPDDFRKKWDSVLLSHHNKTSSGRISTNDRDDKDERVYTEENDKIDETDESDHDMKDLLFLQKIIDENNINIAKNEIITKVVGKLDSKRIAKVDTVIKSIKENQVDNKVSNLKNILNKSRNLKLKIANHYSKKNVIYKKPKEKTLKNKDIVDPYLKTYTDIRKAVNQTSSAIIKNKNYDSGDFEIPMYYLIKDEGDSNKVINNNNNNDNNLFYQSNKSRNYCISPLQTLNSDVSSTD